LIGQPGASSGEIPELVDREFPEVGDNPGGSGLVEFLQRAAARADGQAVGSDGLGTFDIAMGVTHHHNLVALQAPAQVTRRPVPGYPGQLVAILMVVRKGSTNPVSPE
jgi:hypothetical protein